MCFLCSNNDYDPLNKIKGNVKIFNEYSPEYVARITITNL